MSNVPLEDVKLKMALENLDPETLEALEKIKALGGMLPSASTLIDINTSNVFANVFAEPGA